MTAARTRAAAAAMWRRVKGNGCTMAPDLMYAAACRAHDADYTTGTDERGQPITRAQADRRLRLAMQQDGQGTITTYLLLPWIFWIAVRLFGGRHWIGKPSAGSNEDFSGSTPLYSGKSAGK